MKFGLQLSELIDPKFRPYCVAYNKLKSFIHESDSKSARVIQTIQDVTSAVVPYLPAAPPEHIPSVRFQEALTIELDKVNTFAQLECETLLTDLRTVVRKIRSIDRGSASADAAMDSMRSELDIIAAEICAFAGFVSINYTAFRKITKKEAKVHRTSSAAWFMANVARAPFMTVDFDRILTGLSMVFELLRSPQICLDPPAVSTDQRKSLDRVLSAWISMEDLWEVKIALSRNMSLQLFAQGGSRSVIIDNVLSAGTKKAVLGHNRIRCLYFDTPWLESYKTQIESGMKNKGFQAEFEGESVSITLPTGNSFSTSISTWEDLWMRNGQGKTLDPESVEQIKALKKAGYEPLVECTFSRYVFRYEDATFGTIEVRVEEDAVFSYALGTKDQLEDKNSKFTRHTLYIKTPKSAPKELPEWLTDITGMPGVTEIANFAKRTHGLFVYADNRIGVGVPPPAWAIQKTNTVRLRPVQPSPIVTELRDINMENERSPVAGNESRKIQVRDAIIKIEPKSFFACERNLLDWTHTCVVVTGLAALQGGMIGHIVMVFPIFILLWETYLHRVRNTNMLNKDDGEYSDVIGPPLLLCSLLGLCLNLFLSAFFIK